MMFLFNSVSSNYIFSYKLFIPLYVLCLLTENAVGSLLLSTLNSTSPLKLAHHVDCATDVKKLCSSVSQANNFAIIDCLQSDDRKLEDVSETCQHLIWSYKRNATMDYQFDSAASEVCSASLLKIKECHKLTLTNAGRGMVIPCLIEYLNNITDVSCSVFVKRMRTVVFSDYRLIYKFTDRCETDIDRYKCGRLQRQNESLALHKQGATLRCLFEHYDDLVDTCQLELLRVAELQSDDYHTDLQLYHACRDDRETLCPKVRAGEGRVYKCLFKHKFARKMSVECRNMLVNRQQLAQKDYKINLRVAKVCEEDIHKYNCLNEISEVAGFKAAKMSAILLCLEAAVKDDAADLQLECISELHEVRRSMMEDYRVNPILVRDCSHEIDFCGAKLNFNERTMHCLMDLARHKRTKESSHSIDMSAKCTRALEEVITESDVGENYEVDPVLQGVCEQSVLVLCAHVSPGEGRIMSCLLGSLDSSLMSPECKEGLMEVYYFISRDFRLDHRLYKFCHKDAARTCSAPKNWHKRVDSVDAYAPPLGPTVLSCLYRRITHVSDYNQPQHISQECQFEVRRVMGERAHSVDLDPEIEAGCLTDLARYCSDKTQKSQELDCLEENLENLSLNCMQVIKKYTEEVDEDPEISDIFVHVCKPFWNHYCQEALDTTEWVVSPNDTDASGVAENIMNCLIQNKYHPDMNDKCRAGIEHHQLITMKDFHLSHRFKVACENDVGRLCADRSVKKADVVRCLSESVRGDTLQDKDHKVSEPCRRQLRFELLQRSQSIKLDPELMTACPSDVQRFCSNVRAGNAAVIECLRLHQKKLSATCRKVVFKRELEEASDPTIDFLLMSKCKAMSKKYCSQEMGSTVLMYECLRRNKEQESFDKSCLTVITLREQLHAKDYRLNQELESHCSKDISKFCGEELKLVTVDKEADGRVILCLRKQYIRKKLTSSCENHMHNFIAQSANDIKQVATLAEDCAQEIEKHCSHQLDKLGSLSEPDGGRVQQCLIDHVSSNDITETTNQKCFKQVAEILEETQFDITADAVLFRACAVELKEHCGDVPIGKGRKMQCMLNAWKMGNLNPEEDCGKHLGNIISLWKLVITVKPAESFGEYAKMLSASPSKHYFVTVLFCLVGVIFITGLFCGRVTKRVRRDLKSR